MTTHWHKQSAHEIVEAVAKGAVSASAVTEAYLQRIDAVDAKIGAYTQGWDDTARAMAQQVDEKIARGEKPGILAGVPISLKESICTITGKTTCSSKMLENFRSPYDATVVSRLQAADAVFLGKVNMDEFAMGSSTENSAHQKTYNPWNPDYIPGGSSGGSAAAVSAGQCAVSIGSDTSGSVRLPASLCGCVGMKPSYGRISRYGLVALASSMDTIGPLTRSVKDAALVLNALCGADSKDAMTAPDAVPDFTQALTEDIHGLRIGIPKEYFGEELEPQVRERVETAISLLEKNGASLVELSLPTTEYATAVYLVLCAAEASACLARLDGIRYGFRHPDAQTTEDVYVLSKSAGFGPEVRRRILLGTCLLSKGFYDTYFVKAQKVRTLIKRDFEAAFSQCDLIAGPVSPVAGFEFGLKAGNPVQMQLSDLYTVSANLAALPAISVPCGVTDSGLPVGLQLMARPFNEAAILNAAYFYEQNRGFSMEYPTLV